VGDLITNTQKKIDHVGVRTLDEVRIHPARLATFSSEVEAERKQSKDFLYENLYLSSILAPEKDDAERVVSDLFAFWMQNPPPCPASIRKKQKKTPCASHLRLLAGMTDNFIFEQHEKHCGGTT